MGNAASSIDADSISQSMQASLYSFCRPASTLVQPCTGHGELGSLTRPARHTILCNQGEGQLVLCIQQLEGGLADTLRPEERQGLLQGTQVSSCAGLARQQGLFMHEHLQHHARLDNRDAKGVVRREEALVLVLEGDGHIGRSGGVDASEDQLQARCLTLAP